MKKNTLNSRNYMAVIMILFISLIISCGQTTNKNSQEYIGTYQTILENECSIAITITSNDDGYHYKITSSTIEQEGRLEISKTDTEVYFKFIGLIGAAPKESIEAQYINETIVIQNYGNSMNEYIKFSECDVKFIEFEKSEIN